MILSASPPSLTRAVPIKWRILILACLLGAEVLVTSLWFDGATLPTTVGLAGWLGRWGAWILRFAVGFAGIFGTFAYLRHVKTLAALKATQSINFLLLGVHCGLFGFFFVWSYHLYLRGSSDDEAVIVWALLAIAVGLTASLALIPLVVWRQVRSVTGSLWVWSAGASALACASSTLIRGLWEPTTRVTFWLVKTMLAGMVDELVLQPERMRLGTRKFMVIISPECSGLEGLGLLFIFGLLWLTIFRDELRFPRAFLLVPAGMAVLYLSNAMRIAALVLIGDAGARDIAVKGFHSQAGWIAFNVVAFGLSIGARRLAWFSNRPLQAASSDEHPAAPFLMPFLSILAAGMVAGAMSGGFEWLYALRVLACIAALWFFRHDYRNVDWRFGWLAPLIGAVVFVLWMGREWMGADIAGKGMPAALGAATPGMSLVWIVLRIIGGVVTVPIAEELAFRGFGYRRLIADEFETVSWRGFSWSALLVSSVLFGAMHGDRWVAGTAAGVLYAMAMRWRGRLGDAVVAHGVTNALLAVWVLVFGRWDLW